MINTAGMHEYNKIDEKMRKEIENFIADGSDIVDVKVEGSMKDTIYTLWVKEGKYCIVRGFWTDSFQKEPGISVDLAYVSADVIVKQMFKLDPDIFRETLGKMR